MKPIGLIRALANHQRAVSTFSTGTIWEALRAVLPVDSESFPRHSPAMVRCTFHRNFRRPFDLGKYRFRAVFARPLCILLLGNLPFVCRSGGGQCRPRRNARSATRKSPTCRSVATFDAVGKCPDGRSAASSPQFIELRQLHTRNVVQLRTNSLKIGTVFV